jgi:hypothetical protein
MKKMVSVVMLLAGATVAYSQGLINWSDYVSPAGSNPGFAIMVFSAGTVNLGTGVAPFNTVNDLPPGTATYTGAPMGAGYEIGLYVDTSWYAVYLDTYDSTPIATTTFLTGAEAGTWPASGLDATVPELAAGTAVYVELAAWSTAGGATSFAQAIRQGYQAGFSGPSTGTTTLGGSLGGGPPTMPGNLEGIGIQDFGVFLIPEPGTINLVMLGALALSMRLRRKQRSFSNLPKTRITQGIP